MHSFLVALHAPWLQVRLIKILEARVYEPLLATEPLAADALARMRAGDYLELPSEHRFALLAVLVALALQSDLLRCAIT